jgi:hypothetical protein
MPTEPGPVATRVLSRMTPVRAPFPAMLTPRAEPPAELRQALLRMTPPEKLQVSSRAFERAITRFKVPPQTTIAIPCWDWLRISTSVISTPGPTEKVSPTVESSLTTTTGLAFPGSPRTVTPFGGWMLPSSPNSASSSAR